MPKSDPVPFRSPEFPESAYAFDLDGGRPCLNFANTSGTSGEHLDSYAALLAFAAQSDLLTPERAERLHTAALADPTEAETVVERARRLRDALRRVFQAIANETGPAQADVDLLNADLAASLSHARVVAGPKPHTYAWGWSWDTDALCAPLWPIVRSATDVLTSDEERPLVRKCGACNWLFLDTTRNRSRQWCSMQSCGNREKARRHYQRLKAQRTTGAAPGPVDDAPRGRRRGPQTSAAPADAASATAE